VPRTSSGVSEAVDGFFKKTLRPERGRLNEKVEAETIILPPGEEDTRSWCCRGEHELEKQRPRTYARPETARCPCSGTSRSSSWRRRFRLRRGDVSPAILVSTFICAPARFPARLQGSWRSARFVQSQDQTHLEFGVTRMLDVEAGTRSPACGLKNLKTNEEAVLPLCRLVCRHRPGVPNTGMLQGAIRTDENGFIVPTGKAP